MSGTDSIERYRHLREAMKRLHSRALGCVPQGAWAEQAKALGLWTADEGFVGSETETTLVLDLLLYAARPGRTRAIDRFAPPTDPDESALLPAMRDSRFSVWRVERQARGGLILNDVLRDDAETWLLDLNLAASARPGALFAARLCWTGVFAMTCGSLTLMSEGLLEDVLYDVAGWAHRRSLGDVADDPRFARAVYRSAIAADLVDRVVHRDLALAA